ncbi:ribonuclease P protein component [Pirellulales bacterium]|nr:ribonuclease P protein component [Pirellulales bacterium]
MNFPRSSRLLTSQQFDRVFQRRRSRSDSRMIVYACENDVARPRLGLVVSRKCGPSVRRGRWKRCLREAFRLSQHELPQTLDLVIMPRPQADPEMPALRESILRLAGELNDRLQTESRG